LQILLKAKRNPSEFRSTILFLLTAEEIGGNWLWTMGELQSGSCRRWIFNEGGIPDPGRREELHQVSPVQVKRTRTALVPFIDE
jgi:hypothetical protein